MLINKAILIIIGAVLIYAAMAIFSDVGHFIKELQSINLLFLPLILSLITISIVIKGIRQCMILNEIGIQIPKLANMKLFIMGLSMLVTPGSGGEVIKSHFLKQNYNQSMAKTIPCVFVERYHDFLAIIVFLFITLIFVTLIEAAIITIFSFLLIVIVFLIVVQKKWLVVIESKIEKIKPFRAFFINKAEFNQSIFMLFKPKLMFKFGLVSLLSILFESLGIYFGFLSIIPDANFIVYVQMFYTSILAGLFSFLPAGVGVTEGSLIGLLIKKGISVSQASPTVIYVRLISLWFATVLGFMFLKNIKNKIQKI